MSTVIFKTEDAIFQFDRKSVMQCLEHRKTSYQINELDTLIQVLSSQPEQTILSSEHPYFGYIALELIATEGSVICKNCGKRYRSNQLRAYKVEPDNASAEVASAKKGGFKNLFRRKPKPIRLFAGKGIKCPNGHTLIFTVIWKT